MVKLLKTIGPPFLREEPYNPSEEKAKKLIHGQIELPVKIRPKMLTRILIEKTSES